MPGARLDALVSLARRLTRAGAGTAPESLAIAMRTRGWLQVVKTDLFHVGHVLLLLDGRHLHQVTDLLDLTAQRRRVLHNNDGLMVPEPHRLERLSHRRRAADAAPYLLDANLARRSRRFLRCMTRPARAVPDERSRHWRPP